MIAALRNLIEAVTRSVRPDGSRASIGDNALPLRHLAALMVIYGHSYDLTVHKPDRLDLIASAMPGFKGGSLAVHIFFAISGYLVMLSILRDPSVLNYSRNRVLRIFPGYVVSLLVCILLLGPLLTSLPVASYLHDPGTWEYLRANFVPISFSWTLPGVFVANPYPNIVNGSIWSLGLELRWYTYLGLLMALGITKRRWAFSIVATAFLGYAGWEWSMGRPDQHYFRVLSLVFVTSALLAHWREYLRISHITMLFLVVVSIAGKGSQWFGPLATVSVIYASFWFIYRVPAMGWPTNRDYSYGIFLYGFPAQQTIVALVPAVTPGPLFACASLLAAVFAMISWHFVESPALRLKRHAGATKQMAAAIAGNAETGKEI